MKLIFMGTPEIAASILEKVATEHEVVCVYTQPPRPAGKGLKLCPSEVQIMAEKLNIPVRCPKSLKSEEVQQEFKKLQADVGVVCAYGLILPQAILDAPRLGCLNIHASLLPRWRGAAPIQRAIQAGDSESGITIMQMDKGLDTGDMLLKGVVPIHSETTASDLHDALMNLGGDLILETLRNMPSPQKQPSDGVTYAEKIKKEEACIDWSLSAQQIERNIRAFNPFPIAYFTYNNERIRVFKAIVEDKTTSARPGTVLDDRLLIACGEHTCLRLISLQRAGKKKLPLEELLKGWTLPRDIILDF